VQYGRKTLVMICRLRDSKNPAIALILFRSGIASEGVTPEVTPAAKPDMRGLGWILLDLAWFIEGAQQLFRPFIS
jgi:hypothetical protein